MAKYSATGKYLGLFDAFDSYIQLCGGGYTDGRPAFTFGTHFKKTVRDKENIKLYFIAKDIATHFTYKLKSEVFYLNSLNF